MSNYRTPIRILIADDHQLFIAGIQELLSESNEIEVIGEAGNGKELMKLLALFPADLILLDVSMPEMNGEETCLQIKKNYPNVKVLILSQHHDSGTIGQLLDAGADGYLLKEASKRELLLAIQSVMETGRYFSRQASEEYMSHIHRVRSGLRQKEIELTSREREILELIIAEQTAQEIGEKLFLSVNTITTHRKNLLQKFQVRNTAGLVREAVKMGLG